MDGPVSTSVLGFRPFTMRFPNDEGFTFSPRPVSTATATQVPPPIPTKALLNPHLVSEDSPSTSVLTIVLPLLFGALFLLGCGIAIVACLGHRARNKKAAAKLKKKRAIDAELGVDPAQWGSRRAEMAQIELDEFDRQTLRSLKVADDLARARYAASFKTYDLPRKPPPAYEP
ncbi:hypothetical protein JCM10449v2_006941 [Rhodotorula kratochvilovae]